MRVIERQVDRGHLVSSLYCTNARAEHTVKMKNGSRTLVMLAHYERKCWNELPGKFSEQLEQGWSVHGVHRRTSLTTAQFMRNDLGTSESWCYML
jgi:hypothetical protein